MRLFIFYATMAGLFFGLSVGIGINIFFNYLLDNIDQSYFPLLCVWALVGPLLMWVSSWFNRLANEDIYSKYGK